MLPEASLLCMCPPRCSPSMHHQPHLPRLGALVSVPLQAAAAAAARDAGPAIPRWHRVELGHEYMCAWGAKGLEKWGGSVTRCGSDLVPSCCWCCVWAPRPRRLAGPSSLPLISQRPGCATPCMPITTNRSMPASPQPSSSGSSSASPPWPSWCSPLSSTSASSAPSRCACNVNCLHQVCHWTSQPGVSISYPSHHPPLQLFAVGLHASKS